jgi:hypothetical protein
LDKTTMMIVGSILRILPSSTPLLQMTVSIKITKQITFSFSLSCFSCAYFSHHFLLYLFLDPLNTSFSSFFVFHHYSFFINNYKISLCITWSSFNAIFLFPKWGMMNNKRAQ